MVSEFRLFMLDQLCRWSAQAIDVNFFDILLWFYFLNDSISRREVTYRFLRMRPLFIWSFISRGACSFFSSRLVCLHKLQPARADDFFLIKQGHARVVWRIMDILKSFRHPDEIYALLRFKLGGCEAVMPRNNQVTKTYILPVCVTVTVSERFVPESLEPTGAWYGLCFPYSLLMFALK